MINEIFVIKYLTVLFLCTLRAISSFSFQVQNCLLCSWTLILKLLWLKVEVHKLIICDLNLIGFFSLAQKRSTFWLHNCIACHKPTRPHMNQTGLTWSYWPKASQILLHCLLPYKFCVILVVVPVWLELSIFRCTDAYGIQVLWKI